MLLELRVKNVEKCMFLKVFKLVIQTEYVNEIWEL